MIYHQICQGLAYVGDMVKIARTKENLKRVTGRTWKRTTSKCLDINKLKMKYTERTKKGDKKCNKTLDVIKKCTGNGQENV